MILFSQKYSELTEEEIRACFLGMRDSIKQYLKNPNNVKPNLRDVIAETNFNSSFRITALIMYTILEL